MNDLSALVNKHPNKNVIIDELHPHTNFNTYSGTDNNDTCRTHIDHVFASGIGGRLTFYGTFSDFR